MVIIINLSLLCENTSQMHILNLILVILLFFGHNIILWFSKSHEMHELQLFLCHCLRFFNLLSA